MHFADKGRKEKVEYRGIQLDESVKLYKKDGEYNKAIKRSLDELADLLVKKNHILKNEYKGTERKILVDYQCGHEPHSIRVADYKNGIGCPKCSGVCPTQAKADFYKLVETNEHICLGDYLGNEKKILIDFKCGHEPKFITPHDYKQGKKCRDCKSEKLSKLFSKQSREEFILLVEANGHTLLTPYGKNSRQKVLIDFKCGHHEPQEIIIDSYKKTQTCPECNIEKSKITIGKIKRQKSKRAFENLLKQHNNILLSEFKTRHDLVLIDYQCGHEPHKVRPCDYNGNCPYCVAIKQGEVLKKRAEKAFISLVKKNKHILLSQYKGADEHILIDFRCGHPPHELRPTNYKMGSGCPKCSLSKGVKAICKWLDENEIKYELEYSLPLKKWRYDIFIASENLIVEVHGIQHFKFIEHFHRTKKNFYKRAQIDHEKWAYACSLGYNYLEIDYREHIPELALERFLKEFDEMSRNETRQELQLSLF